MTVEQQNISALNSARKNQTNQEPDGGAGGSKTDSRKKLDLSEFLMWETGLTIFWLALGGWIPFWGGIANDILIGIIYIWYASQDLNPPSFSPAKITKLAPVAKLVPIAKIAAVAGIEKTEDIIKKMPGGGTLLFILAVLSGGVGIIPTPMVLFFSIYLANSESRLLQLIPKQGGTGLAGENELTRQTNVQKGATELPLVRTPLPTTHDDDAEKLRRMRSPEQTRPNWMQDKRAVEGAKRDQERFEVAKRLGMSGEEAAKRAMDIREKE